MFCSSIDLYFSSIHLLSLQTGLCNIQNGWGQINVLSKARNAQQGCPLSLPASPSAMCCKGWSRRWSRRGSRRRKRGFLWKIRWWRWLEGNTDIPTPTLWSSEVQLRIVHWWAPFWLTRCQLDLVWIVGYQIWSTYYWKMRNHFSCRQHSGSWWSTQKIVSSWFYHNEGITGGSRWSQPRGMVRC